MRTSRLSPTKTVRPRVPPRVSPAINRPVQGVHLPFASRLATNPGVPCPRCLDSLPERTRRAIFPRRSGQKGFERLKPLGQLNSEQIQREGKLLSHLLGENRMEDLARFESDLTQQQSRLLFEITTEIEDTENALRQAEQLVQRLKNHLDQLRGLQRVLSK